MASEGRTPRQWGVFWSVVTNFDKGKMNAWMGLRNTIGVALPLAAGIAAGQPVAGALMSTGALNVSFSDSRDPYGQRARRMLASSFLGALAISVGALSGNSTFASVLLTAIWAFVAGIMVAVGTAPSDLGTVSLVALVVFHARPMNPENATLSGLAALVGGLLQTGLSLLLWPVRRYEPERRALGKLFRDLGQITKGPVDGQDSPRASSQITEARQALVAIERQHTLEAHRCLSLLNQAERIRLSLLTLGRLKARMERDEQGRSGAGRIELILSLASRILTSIGNVLTTEKDASEAECLTELQDQSELLRTTGQDVDSAFLAAVFESARFQTDALAGQLRAAMDLAASATPEGTKALREEDRSKPWQLRLAGNLATLRANLNLGSSACRHAIRLATCVALGEALGRSLSWQRTYWLPMTVAIVLKPDFTATFSRGVLRVAGTLIGLVFATIVFHFLPSGVGSEIILVAGLTFALRWAGPAHYGVLVAAVSALVVMLIAVSGIAPNDVIVARGLNTLAGGALALVAYIVWPTWQHTQIREMMATMLDAYRDYFRRVSQVYIQPSTRDDEKLDSARVAARLARSNVEASIDRMSAEPGVPVDALSSWNAMLASSHGFINGVMALEAALPGENDEPAPDSFRAFAYDVEISLHSIASALRGSKIVASALPDLRADYQRLMQSQKPWSGRQALLGMEADRITNRLNTLGEQVVKWVTAHPVPISFGPS
jgi:uncharacterized membrane protein YccC